MKLDNKYLNVKTEKFDFNNPVFDPIVFARDMCDTMLQLGGVGLAANQIGYNVSCFCMRGDPEFFVCYNPRIVIESEEKIDLEEGCLSFPNLVLLINRPKHVKIRFETPNGETLTKIFTGITARTVLHEIEHLQGKNFSDNVSKLKLDIAKRKSRKK